MGQSVFSQLKHFENRTYGQRRGRRQGSKKRRFGEGKYLIYGGEKDKERKGGECNEEGKIVATNQLVEGILKHNKSCSGTFKPTFIWIRS